MSWQLKYAINILVFSVIAWVVVQPLGTIGSSKKYMSLPVAGQRFTPQELEDFLYIWSKMNNSSLRGIVGQLSLKSEYKYPKELVNWLEVQQWNPDRFFYNEQRLSEIMVLINLKNSIRENETMQRISNINLQNIINEQYEVLKQSPFDEEEINLVAGNLTEINKFFEHKKILEDLN